MIRTAIYSFPILFWEFVFWFSIQVVIINIWYAFHWQHPFITNAKPVTILRDLITEAMEMKIKRQQEQQRELEEDDENSVR